MIKMDRMKPYQDARSLLAKLMQAIDSRNEKSFASESLPLDDKPTLSLFAKGDTENIPMFDDAESKIHLNRMKPDCFEDLCICYLLTCPGFVQENLEQYITRKLSQEKISYPFSALKPILEYTHGVFVYQEQGMRSLEILASFTKEESKAARRMSCKRHMEGMAQYQILFLEKVMANGYSRKSLEDFWEFYSRYCVDFNAERGFIINTVFTSYSIAYIKAHYPDLFSEVMGTVKEI